LILVDPPFDATRSREHIVVVEKLRHAGPGPLEAELLRREPGMGDLFANALAGLYRQASDGAFQAVLKSEEGFPSVAAQLANIQAETLIVAADPKLDAALGAEAAAKAVGALKHGKLITIAGARHAVHASKPRDFAQAVIEFVRES
jgi:pimeloyl-ACP methyl ester carboxylesterase